ncbi:hypothetical protein F4780DRAFT_531822 [Xylariomycetidae sp. FL0641]|nr:hypothetical protein F4780DRAFT_531822 [Xylariomycetidae sp. FL0641]
MGKPEDNYLSPNDTGNGGFLRRSRSNSSQRSEGKPTSRLSRFFSRSGSKNKGKDVTGAAPDEDLLAPPPPYDESVAASASSAFPNEKSPSTATSFTNFAVHAEAQTSAGAKAESPKITLDDLKVYDTVFLIDDSGSMTSGDNNSTLTRWEETRLVIATIASTCTKYDEDGIDLYFFNTKSGKPDDGKPDEGESVKPGKPGMADTGFYAIRDVEKVYRAFNEADPTERDKRYRRTGNSEDLGTFNTPTKTRLKLILGVYMDAYKEAHKKEYEEAYEEAYKKALNKALNKAYKKRGQISQGSAHRLMTPLNLIVITDGMPDRNDEDPSRDEDPDKYLEGLAKDLDELHKTPIDQVGVQFFQVGNDKYATAALKRWDGDSKPEVKRGEYRDIVDTSSWDKMQATKIPGLSEDAILKVVLGGVQKRLDKERLTFTKEEN